MDSTLSALDERKQAVGIITLVGEHAGAWLETRDRAARWLCERSAGLTPVELAAAQAQGRGMDYEAVVKQVMGN